MPRWFAAAVAGGATGVAAGGVVGLLLAVVGVFAWPLALVAGLVGAGVGALLVWRSAPDGGDGRWAVAAVVVAAVFVVANWGVVGGSVVLERDPGLYANAATWVEREGTLAVDARVGPFAADDSLEFVSVGMYDLDGDTLEFQSNHLTPVLLAVGLGAGGTGAMQRVPLLLVAGGLLAVYALGVRVTGRPWAALMAVVALAMSLPVLGAARDTLSEPVVLLLLWAGLWLWSVAADGERRWLALLAGLCIGACVATRIDAAAYLVPVPLVLAFQGRRLTRPFVVGLVPGVVAAVLDVGLRSRGYLGDLEVEVALLYALLGASVVAGLAVARWRPRVRAGARSGDVLAGVVVAALVLAWLVRPFVQTALAQDSDLVASIQAAQGDEVDGRRRYHELSMVWQAWYLGTFLLAAAIAGAAVVVRQLVARADRAVVLPLAALAAGTALYLFRPAIAPDQLWAMRRFVPAAMPLLCVLAGVAATRVPRRAVLALLVVVALVPIALRTWPVRAFREQAGFATIVERTCDVVGGGAVLLPEGTRVAATMTQTIRSWCDVPAAIASAGTDVDELASAWDDEGRTLWVVADVPEQLPAGGEVVVLGPVANDRQLEDTLTSPPDEYERFELNAVATRVGGG